MAATKVYVLDSGTLEMDGFHVFWNRGPGGPVRIPVYSVLVVHAQGNLLYDTGYDLDHVNRVLPFEKPQQTPEQTIPAQLALVGLEPADISVVAVSHFHFDHCGGVKHLPNANVIAHRLEFAAAEEPEPFERLGYSDLSFRSQADGTRAVAMEGDLEVLPGVHLLATPGHSRGHCSLMVQLEDRPPLIFAGDAIYTEKSLETECIAGFHYDPVASIRSMRRLKALAEETKGRLFFSHEAESYAAYPKPPAHF
jgi:4-pyridoxolactonase